MSTTAAYTLYIISGSPVWFILSGLNGIGRLYFWNHHVSDVCVGTLVAYLTIRLAVEYFPDPADCGWIHYFSTVGPFMASFFLPKIYARVTKKDVPRPPILGCPSVIRNPSFIHKE